MIFLKQDKKEEGLERDWKYVRAALVFYLWRLLLLFLLILLLGLPTSTCRLPVWSSGILILNLGEEICSFSCKCAYFEWIIESFSLWEPVVPSQQCQFPLWASCRPSAVSPNPLGQLLLLQVHHLTHIGSRYCSFSSDFLCKGLIRDFWKMLWERRDLIESSQPSCC